MYEIFDLKNPTKEELQKYSKVDHLFKNFLEMNYVLRNHSESTTDLLEIAKLQNKVRNNGSVPADQEPEIQK